DIFVFWSFFCIARTFFYYFIMTSTEILSPELMEYLTPSERTLYLSLVHLNTRHNHQESTMLNLMTQHGHQSTTVLEPAMATVDTAQDLVNDAGATGSNSIPAFPPYHGGVSVPQTHLDALQADVNRLSQIMTYQQHQLSNLRLQVDQYQDELSSAQ